jgi:hypothetical protein
LQDKLAEMLSPYVQGCWSGVTLVRKRRTSIFGRRGRLGRLTASDQGHFGGGNQVRFREWAGSACGRRGLSNPQAGSPRLGQTWSWSTQLASRAISRDSASRSELTTFPLRMQSKKPCTNSPQFRYVTEFVVVVSRISTDLDFPRLPPDSTRRPISDMTYRPFTLLSNGSDSCWPLQCWPPC